MSSHFSANQYETAFSSQRLQNYQVPAKHKQHPSLRSGTTKIVTNDRGHLIGDAKRAAASPWGSFVGTWQMERRPVQLKTTTKLHTRYTETGNSTKSSRASSAPSTRANSTSRQSKNGSNPPSRDATQSPHGGAASVESTVKSMNGSTTAAPEQVSGPSSAVSGSRSASGSRISLQESGKSLKTASSVASSARVGSAQSASRVSSVEGSQSVTSTPFEVISLPQSAGSFRSASVAFSIPEEDRTIQSMTPSQTPSRMSDAGSRMSTAFSEASGYSSVASATPLVGGGEGKEEGRGTPSEGSQLHGSVTPTSNHNRPTAL